MLEKEPIKCPIKYVRGQNNCYELVLNGEMLLRWQFTRASFPKRDNSMNIPLNVCVQVYQGCYRTTSSWISNSSFKFICYQPKISKRKLWTRLKGDVKPHSST